MKEKTKAAEERTREVWDPNNFRRKNSPVQSILSAGPDAGGCCLATTPSGCCQGGNEVG